MLSMMKRRDIQTLKKAGHTHAEIARLLGVSERSVERVVQEPEIESVDDGAERTRRQVGRPSKVAPFRKWVRKALEEELDLSSMELLRRARAEGYTGQKSAFYTMVRELRPPKQDLVVRFEGVPGEFSQHDFGEVRVRYLDGRTERIVFFATRLKFSRWVQVSLVADQRVEALARATCEHFHAIGGIPLLAVFDRPKTVALEWKKDGTITRYNPVFAQAMLDMGVGVEVCWPHAPRQKGAVENLVGWVKSSFFKSRKFRDRDDLEAQLSAWHHEVNEQRPSRATGVPPAERMATERERLRPLKVAPDDLAIRQPIRVGPTGMVSLEGARYSMDPKATGCSGTAWLYPDRVHIEAARWKASHPRLRSDEKSVLREHRAARLAHVSGQRGKRYLMRQDILDLGDIALTLLDEIVHRRRPNGWFQDVEVLHELLQVHGEGPLKLAMHMAVARGEFSGDEVAAHLAPNAAEPEEVLPC